MKGVRIMNTLTSIGESAKLASYQLATITTKQKNDVLTTISRKLIENTKKIIEANHQDLLLARQNGISESLIDRLKLDEQRINDMAKSVIEIASLADPVGRILGGETRPNGLKIEKVSVPLGILGIIYEARPNVTVDAACLCLKSSNTVILRGGKEAIESNIVLSEIMRDALIENNLSRDCIQLIHDTSRTSSQDLMTLTGYIDALIPRGGKSLIQAVVRDSKVPVIETGAGNCHIFVDESADLQMALDICINAKTSRPSVCNAVETVLIHQNIASHFLTLLVDELSKYNVDIRGCVQCKKIVPTVSIATDEDYETEYDDLILALRVVPNIDEAIQHIRKYTTHHSEAIITNSLENSTLFTSTLDSAALYVNASTRFTDGSEFGFGAEIGISTQKLHARGPMGLNELTSYKYIINGNGQVR